MLLSICDSTAAVGPWYWTLRISKPWQRHCTVCVPAHSHYALNHLQSFSRIIPGGRGCNESSQPEIPVREELEHLILSSYSTSYQCICTSSIGNKCSRVFGSLFWLSWCIKWVTSSHIQAALHRLSVYYISWSESAQTGPGQACFGSCRAIHLFPSFLPSLTQIPIRCWRDISEPWDQGTFYLLLGCWHPRRAIMTDSSMARTPLPKIQIFLVLLIQITEPITAQVCTTKYIHLSGLWSV